MGHAQLLHYRILLLLLFFLSFNDGGALGLIWREAPLTRNEHNNYINLIAKGDGQVSDRVHGVARRAAKVSQMAIKLFDRLPQTDG